MTTTSASSYDCSSSTITKGSGLPAFTLTSLSTWFRYETFNVYSVPFVPVNRNFPSRSVETPVPSSAMNIVAKLSGLPSESRTTPSTVALSVCAKSAEHRPDIKKAMNISFFIYPLVIPFRSPYTDLPRYLGPELQNCQNTPGSFPDEP